MKNSLASWTIAHFAVDMSCFYILYRGVEQLYVALSWSHWQEVLGWAILLSTLLSRWGQEHETPAGVSFCS